MATLPPYFSHLSACDPSNTYQLVKQTFRFDNKSLNPLKVRTYQLQISPRAPARYPRFTQKKISNLKKKSLGASSEDSNMINYQQLYHGSQLGFSNSVESRALDLEVEQPHKFSQKRISTLEALSLEERTEEAKPKKKNILLSKKQPPQQITQPQSQPELADPQEQLEQILLEHIKEETGESVDSGLADSGYTMKSNFDHYTVQVARSFDQKKKLLKHRFSTTQQILIPTEEDVYQNKHVSLTEMDESPEACNRSFGVVKYQKSKSMEGRRQISAKNTGVKQPQQVINSPIMIDKLRLEKILMDKIESASRNADQIVFQSSSKSPTTRVISKIAGNPIASMQHLKEVSNYH